MKRIILSVVVGMGWVSSGQALEILQWERVPLSVTLVVGEERVVFVDRNIRIGVPVALGERLRVQSAGGALYFRANAPIETSRLQLQDADTGALILLDVTARPAEPDQPPLEPIRIVDGTRAPTHKDPKEPGNPIAVATPIPAVLTRYAAQSLYAPLRTIEPVIGVAQVPFHRTLALDTLLPTLPVNAKALAAWRLGDYWVTAVKLTHTQSQWLTLDPRRLQGNFIAATFQHPDLGPAGDSTDTSVAYLVTRGSGLAEALLPALSAIDASLNPPAASGGTGHGYEHQK